VKIDTTYVVPRHDHNPMEPHAATAAWDGRTMTLWDKTHWTQNVAAAFGMMKPGCASCQSRLIS